MKNFALLEIASALVFLTTSGSVDTTKPGLTSTSSGMVINGTAGPTQFQDSGTATGQVGTKGLEFTANHAGTISNPSVLRKSGNVVLSGGTAGDVVFNVGVSSTATDLMKVTNSGGLVFLANVTTPGATVTAIASVSGVLTSNVATGKSYDWQIAASSVATLSATALNLTNTNHLTLGSGGSVSTTSRQIVGTSTGMNFTVPASAYYILAIGSNNRFLVQDNTAYNLPPGTNNCTYGNGSASAITTGATGNSIFGTQAGSYLTTGSYCTIVGFNAAQTTGNITSYNGHTLIGAFTGANISTGATYWTCLGYGAGYSGSATATGSYHVFIGYLAGNQAATMTSASRAIGIGSTVFGGLTTGTDNIAIGYLAGRSVSTAQDTVGIGQAALGGGVNPHTGIGSIGIGYHSLWNLTSGNYNVGIGYNIANSLNTGTGNVFLGYGVAVNATSASYNVGIGYQALGSGIATGSGYNVAIGVTAMLSLTTGINSVAVGSLSLYSNLIGNNCTALGYQALYQSTTDGNTGLGYQAGYGITTATYSIAIGYQAMSSASGAHTGNIAIGYQAGIVLNASATDNVGIGTSSLGRLSAGTTGSYNLALINGALSRLTSGSYNIAIGAYAGNSGVTGITSGSYNILIGTSTEAGSATGDRQINIGDAFVRDTSGNVYLNQGSTGSTNIFTAASTTLTIASGIKFILTSGSAPTTSSSSGTAGQIGWDSSYIYVCTATNTWKRAALSTW